MSLWMQHTRAGSSQVWLGGLFYHPQASPQTGLSIPTPFPPPPFQLGMKPAAITQAKHVNLTDPAALIWRSYAVQCLDTQPTPLFPSLFALQKTAKLPTLPAVSFTKGRRKMGCQGQEDQGKRISRDRKAGAKSARWVWLHCMRSWAAPAQSCRAPGADSLWVQGCPRGCRWSGGTPQTRCYIIPVSLAPMPFHQRAGWETGWIAKCRWISRTEAYYFYLFIYFNFDPFALQLDEEPRKTRTVSAWCPVPEGASSAVVSTFPMRQGRGCPGLAAGGGADPQGAAARPPPSAPGLRARGAAALSAVLKTDAVRGAEPPPVPAEPQYSLPTCPRPPSAVPKRRRSPARCGAGRALQCPGRLQPCATQPSREPAAPCSRAALEMRCSPFSAGFLPPSSEPDTEETQSSALCHGSSWR